MSALRDTDGTPIWLPGHQDHHMVKRERRAYQADEGARALIEIGLFETGKKFVFRCPLCGNQVTNDQRLEPVCTGPDWRDTHAMEPMILVA